MSHLDVDLEALLSKLMNHETSRLRKLGIKSEESLACLRKASLMPEEISVGAANYLAELLAHEEEGDNAAFFQPHGPGMTRHPVMRRNGKGWSREFIESRFSEHVQEQTKRMVNALTELGNKKIILQEFTVEKGKAADNNK